MTSRKLLLLSLIASLTLTVASGATLGQETKKDEGIRPRPPDKMGAQAGTGAEAGKKVEDGASQEAGATSKPVGGSGDERGKMDWTFPLIMVGVFVLMYVWMGRGKKKRETQRREMLASLKKGDKVTSIGGIVGTAIEVREDEVIVKVDENNNVRMRFARWAIRGVGEQAKKESPEDK